eukprot:gnl/TRDRNA2_/TRDRNA2_41623_c0_seq1.p1 gnl/TRDRNA2_/TRDRNA2_41623_c0~~gnl/TRDRNA2_/TRDRNA2_41623_c0_seq1.p1  ORF type:complete len:240 (-),score=36.35 gnl/TRDRNA2_/TRDRNA2_41623_c0_seq1:77-796(-)
MQSAQAMQGRGGPGGAVSIEKNMTWRLAFFVASVVTSVSGVVAVFHMIFEPGLELFSFIVSIFLLFFGLVMLILDMPIQTQHPAAVAARRNVTKFFLFMNRFTGRGLWYMFLGTMIFHILFDANVAAWLGALLGTVVVLVGGVATYFGVMLSRKLDQVRLAIMSGPPPAIPPQGFTKMMFRDLVASTTGQGGVRFTDDELDYIVNALTYPKSYFEDQGDPKIDPMDFQFWLSPGRMTLV